VITAAVVAGVGARTPLGLNAAQTGFLLRTGSPVMAEAPLVDAAEEPITMCFDPTLDRLLIGPERAAKIACAALEEAVAPLGDAVRAMRLGLLLCIDERFAQKARVPEGARLAGIVHTRARELVPGISLDVSARGAAGAAFALPRVLEALASRQIDGVLLGGAHSDYDPEVIKEIDGAGRLFTSSNTNALVPGESAAFVLLTHPDVARRAGLTSYVRVLSVGSAVERARPDNDVSAFEATGLTAAVRAATAEFAADSLTAGWCITDHTFETRRISEWHAMAMRTRAVWSEPFVVESPAQRLGHLGAAALPLAMVLASEGYRRGYAPAPVVLAVAGSDAGERGVVAMARS
jgi:3-oxoacyl-[acyl-carrier-protein] synthase-1